MSLEKNNKDLHDPIINLDAYTCPNREQRAHGINVYYGKATELVRDAKSLELNNSERKFQQASDCVLNFYLSVRVNTIRDAAVRRIY